MMKPPNYPFRILLFTCLGHALTHVYMILFPPLLKPMGKAFELDKAGITFYMTIANLFFGLGAVPAGWLSDRLGEKALLAIFFAGSAIGGVMIGIAESQWMLGAGAVVLGLSTSIYHPVGNALISKGIQARGRAMGVNGIAGSVGIAIGPVFAAVVAVLFDWRYAFIGLAAPSLLLFLWLLLTDLGPAATPVHRRLPVRDPVSGTPGPLPRLPIAWIGFYVLMLGAMTLTGFHFQLFTTLLPEHLSGIVPEEISRWLEERFSSADIDAGKILAGGVNSAIALTFGAVGQYIAGWMSDRWNPRGLYIAVLALIAPAVFIVGQLDGWPLLAASCAASVAAFGAQPIENTAIARYSREGWRGAIYGAKFILAFGLGGTGSWVAGLIARDHGIPPVYTTAAAVALLALICATIASRIPLRE